MSIWGIFLWRTHRSRSWSITKSGIRPFILAWTWAYTVFGTVVCLLRTSCLNRGLWAACRNHLSIFMGPATCFSRNTSRSASTYWAVIVVDVVCSLELTRCRPPHRSLRNHLSYCWHFCESGPWWLLLGWISRCRCQWWGWFRCGSCLCRFMSPWGDEVIWIMFGWVMLYWELFRDLNVSDRYMESGKFIFGRRNELGKIVLMNTKLVLRFIERVRIKWKIRISVLIYWVQSSSKFLSLLLTYILL